MRYEFFIGLRYLRARRRQIFISVITLISILGVMVGTAALIIVLSVMVGVVDDLKQKILGANSHLTVLNYHGLFEDYEDVMDRISGHPEVIGVSPYLESQAMLVSGSRVEGVVIRGIDPDTAEKVTTIGEHTLSGGISRLKPRDVSAPVSDDNLPGIAIGRDLSLSLGTMYGDVISMVSPLGALGPMGMTPSVRKFRVDAVFQFGFYEVDSAFAFIHIKEAQRFLHTADQAQGIEVKLEDFYHADAVARDIDRELGFPFWCRTWSQAHKPLFAALKLERIAFAIILALIMLVAGLNIVSMLVMVVMEKYRDIAILKSMGATDPGIMRIFMTQGVFIGVVGTLLGVIVGLFACWLQIEYKVVHIDPAVYQFSVMPMKVEWEYVVGVVIFTLLTSFLATIYPARQASRMNPAESLRYE